MQMTKAVPGGAHVAPSLCCTPGGRRGGPVAKCLSERGDDRGVTRLRAVVALAGAAVLLALVALQAGTGAESPPAGTAVGG